MKIEQAVKTILNPISNFKNICRKKNLIDCIKQLAIGIFKLLAWALIAPPLIGGVILLGCYIKKNCCKKPQNAENEINQNEINQNEINQNEMHKDGFGAKETFIKSNRERSVLLFTKFQNLHDISYWNKSGVFIDVVSEPNKNAVNEFKEFVYKIIDKTSLNREILIKYRFKEGYQGISEEGEFFLYAGLEEGNFIKLEIEEGQYYNINNFISKAFSEKNIEIPPEKVNLNDD